MKPPSLLTWRQKLLAGWAVRARYDLLPSAQGGSQILATALFVEERGDSSRLNTPLDECLPDSSCQDEGQAAAKHLLVLGDGLHQHRSRRQFARNIGEPRRQACGLEVGRNTNRILGVGKAEPGREVVRQHHADGDALAMQQAARIARRLFERVAEGMAKIEQRSDARLLLVGEHEAGLVGAGMSDRLGERRAMAEDFPALRLEPVEE